MLRAGNSPEEEIQMKTGYKNGWILGFVGVFAGVSYVAFSDDLPVLGQTKMLQKLNRNDVGRVSSLLNTTAAEIASKKVHCNVGVSVEDARKYIERLITVNVGVTKTIYVNCTPDQGKAAEGDATVDSLELKFSGLGAEMYRFRYKKTTGQLVEVTFQTNSNDTRSPKESIWKKK